MNNRNLEYDEEYGYSPPHAEMVANALRGLDERRGVGAFLKAIMDAAPNGERVVVQYFRNGDWFVGKPEEARKIAARERFGNSIGKRKAKRSSSDMQMIAAILEGKYDDCAGFRHALAEEFLAEKGVAQ
jgi:hypothetical protein